MPRYQDTGKIIGYAHVEYKKASEAQKACELNGSDLKGRYLDVSVANQKDSKHFVGQLFLLLLLLFYKINNNKKIKNNNKNKKIKK